MLCYGLGLGLYIPPCLGTSGESFFLKELAFFLRWLAMGKLLIFLRLLLLLWRAEIVYRLRVLRVLHGGCRKFKCKVIWVMKARVLSPCEPWNKGFANVEVTLLGKHDWVQLAEPIYIGPNQINPNNNLHRHASS